MTSRDFLASALRWWYVVLAGAVLSLGAVQVATHQPVVYWTQFNVLLLGPRIPEFPNYLEDPRYTVHPMVGLVVSDLTGGDPGIVTASTETNMVGEGLSDGVQVRVPNLGTQWQRDPTASWIDVQVAAPTPELVDQRSAETVRRIAAALRTRQDALGIDPRMRVTSVAATDDPTTYLVQGSRLRAAAATGLTGASLTFVLVHLLERRRTRRRPQAPAPRADGDALPVPPARGRSQVAEPVAG